MWTCEYAGRLIDLDLSSVSDEALHNPEDVPLTFSTPFLALDLLKATTTQQHLYRHDLESFYWSFLWIVLEHVRIKDTEFSLESWRKGAKETRANSKQMLFKRSTRRRVFSKLSRKFPSHEPITDCLKKLTRLMAKAYKELDTDSETDSDSDLDVGREEISYEAFLSILA